MTLRNIDALFNGRRLAVLGDPQTDAQRQLFANMRASVDAARRYHVSAEPDSARLPDEALDCAVIADAAWGQAGIIAALANRGVRAVFWATNIPVGAAVLRAARPYNLRVLGGRSAGVISPRSQLNLSTLALTPPPGQVAFIGQSQSLTAAALDWAVGRRIGFSWLACTGAEVDIDIADLLDYAALDPRTRAVVLQIGWIRTPRKFMSAARAAARVKPVLVLQTRRATASGPQGPDPIRSAAFARAGLVECHSLGGAFDGLAALELLPGLRGDRVAVLGNGTGVCALGTDALLRQHIAPARVGAATRQQLERAAPDAHDTGAAIDLGHTSDHAETVAALKAVLADDNIDSALLVHSPVAGHAHAPLMQALIAAKIDARLMTVWLGLETALAARRSSAAARLATFTSVDEAARAITYRARYRRTQELLTATPPPDPKVTADAAAVRARLVALADDGVEWLSAEDTANLLTAYGIADEQPSATALQVHITGHRHPELGMVLGVKDELLSLAPAYGFAPLDTLLASRLLESASAGRISTPQAAFAALAAALVRISKMIIDLAPLVYLDIRVAVGPQGRWVAPADSLLEITGDPVPERLRLAMAPYPAHMRHRVTLAGDKRYLISAIRPSDEPAVLELLDSLSPEEIRLRFFSYIRYFSHDMAARMTQIDYDREISLVASDVATQDQLAGLATLIADPDGLVAEFALLVHHAHSGRGLGRHLLDCLLRAAGARGIHTVYGDVLADNRPMLALARSLGFRVQRPLEDASSVQVTIDVRNYARAGAAS